MVTRQQFSAIVAELKSNTDFFDPVMLDEFSEGQEDGSIKTRPTTYEMVRDEFDMTLDQINAELANFVEVVNTDDLFDVISFLEGYSDVDLYAPSRGEPMDNLIRDWWLMYASEHHPPAVWRCRDH